MSNLSCGTHVAEPSANKDCRKLLNQFCRFLPKLKLPISADAKLPLTPVFARSSILSKPASRMLSKKWLRRSETHPPGQVRPRWLRHLVRAGLPQQLRCGCRRCSSAWFGG